MIASGAIRLMVLPSLSVMREIISPLDGIRSPFGPRRGGVVPPFTPALLFASGEQGVWYDPSDISTLFQDSAGTTPVTAVEQPVGRMLDLSGRGNHATQATSAARPTLSARVNLLTKTEQFDDAAWTKSALNVTANTNVAPDGTTTADTVASNGVSSTPAITQVATISSIINYIARLYVLKTSGATRFPSSSLYFAGGGTAREWGCVLNTNTGVAYPASGWADGAPTTTVTSVGDYWLLSMQQASLTGNTTAQTFFSPGVNTTGNSGTRSPTTTGSNVIWGADIRVANDTALPVYQRVNTATDYNATGFPYYLRFDGVDDSMATASIDFTATDAMSVFSGLRKLSDATINTVLELSALSGDPSTPGSFQLYTIGNASTWFGYGYNSYGTSVSGAQVFSGYPSPLTSVLSGLSDISGDTAVLRYNGVQIAQSTANQGTGNYGTYPLYIGSRGGTTNRFNGRIYSLIVRGAATSETQIGQTEQWISNEMGGGYYPTGFDFLVDANGDQLTDASGNPLYTIPLYS